MNDLLATIVANPADSLSRQIYADYLSDAGMEHEAAAWREPQEVATVIRENYGDGYSCGDGYGYGYGDGNGDGDGDGYGNGDGYGYGYGDGDGDGYGYGYGYGYGDGYGNGDGSFSLEVLMHGRYVLVCEAGFVLVGEVRPHDSDFQRVVIDNASFARRWGTTAGLGQLANDGKQSATVLDRAGSEIDVLRNWIKCAIPVSDKAWKTLKQ